LVTKADGTKFGKTESGTVWLDPDMMSPYAFYQFWIQAEDAKVGEYLRLFTFLPTEEIDVLVEEHQQDPGLRVAQRRLAAEVTALVHGQAEVDAAMLASSALFGGGDLTELAESTLGAALREAGAVDLALNDAPTIVDALDAAGLVKSRSEARRAISEGGAYLNNVRVDDPDLVLDTPNALAGGWVVLRRGKRAVSGVRLV
jgi:tyrosyl-tRNA synthetase